jgi:hypothetical protein
MQSKDQYGMHQQATRELQLAWFFKCIGAPALYLALASSLCFTIDSILAKISSKVALSTLNILNEVISRQSIYLIANPLI